MSSLFGIGVSKFTGTGTPDSLTQILYYSTLDPVFSEKVLKMFESVVSSSGKRTWKVKGRYATFNVFVHLHKYDTNPLGIGGLPSSKTFYSTLLTYENNDVVFYPFKDGVADGDGLGKAIKNSASANVNCRLVDIQNDFLIKPGSRLDVCTLVFKTNEFYDISKLVQ